MVFTGSGCRGRGREGADGLRVGADDMHAYSIRICGHVSSRFLNTGAVFWEGVADRAGGLDYDTIYSIICTSSEQGAESASSPLSVREVRQ